MKFLLAMTSLLIIATCCSAMTHEWLLFKSTHGKTYPTKMEERFRRFIYQENKKKIEEHNNAYENGKVSYKMKMNQFGDMLPSEFSELMNGLRMSASTKRNGLPFVPVNVELPNSVDWRNKGAVTGVKNQKQCGSCWAFSATGSLEGQTFLKTGKLVSLSEQNLVDCSTKYGNNGCSGGLMDQAFNYVKANKGIDTESSYPYEARDKTCRFKSGSVGTTDRGHVDIPQGDERALQNAVATVGPISVAIDAGHQSFQFYDTGIYDEPNCSNSQLDHGVLAIGYGSDNGRDYWIVKNSWGQSWGEKGYIKMLRNRNNACGIASMASYPLV